MKKLLFAISVAIVALASCQKFADEGVVNFEKADVPTVKLAVTGDNSVSFTVTPGANTGYYAYALLSGEVDPKTVDAATLLAGKVAGSVDKDVLNAAKAASVEKEVKKLTPNAKYTLVAVASSKGTQSRSEVVGTTVTTTDETVPDVKSYDFEVDSSKLTYFVTFDDPVELSAIARFTVRKYAKNIDGGAPYYILQPIDELIVTAKMVDGDVVVEVPEDFYTPGAFTALFISAGSVVNALGAVNEEFSDNVIILNGQYAGTIEGLIAQYDNVNFDLVSPLEEEEVVKFSDPEEFALTLEADLFGEDNVLFGQGEGAISVSAYLPSTGRTVTYALQNWALDETAGNAIVLGLDEGPDFGYVSNYDIEEGTVEDLFGNVNNALAIEDQVLYSFGYTLEDVVGTYSYAFLNTDETVSTGEFILTEADEVTVLGDDDEYECNVMFTKFFNWDLRAPLYAVFDPDAGTVTIPDWQQIYMQPVVEDGAVVDAYIFIYSTYNNAATSFSVPKPGTFGGFNDDAFGYAVYQYTTQQRLGFVWFLDSFAQRTGPVPAADPAPVATGLNRISVEKGNLPAIK